MPETNLAIADAHIHHPPGRVDDGEMPD